MKTLMIAALVAVAAPSASAGDVDFHFGFRTRGGVRIGFGYHDTKEVRRVPHVVRGHYDTVEERVWIPAHYETVHHPAEYRYRYDECGVRVRVLVRRAGYHRVRVPGHYETRIRKVWHPGHRSRGRHVEHVIHRRH